MRYRSATVAGLHGLPCATDEEWKEPQDDPSNRQPPPPCKFHPYA